LASCCRENLEYSTCVRLGVDGEGYGLTHGDPPRLVAPLFKIDLK
jgi:hypothetical protein